MFAALAEPTRRDILEMLSVSGKLSATDISNKFTMTAAAISQHLKILRQTQLVTVEKKAQRRLYQINADAFLELEAWTHKLAQRGNESFEKFAENIK